MLSRLDEWVRRVVRSLRKRASARTGRSQAAPAIRQFRQLRTAHPGRRLCAIFLVEHIGDIVACEPVIDWVRHTNPGASVAWVVKEEYRELLAHHPGLDAVVGVESLAAVAPIIQSGVVDTCFDLHVNHKPTGLKNLDHEKAWGSPDVDCFNYFDHGSILKAFSTAAGLPALSGAPQLRIPDHMVKSVDALRLPARFVVVHTTSNDPTKDWPASSWRELVDHVAETSDIPIIEVGLAGTIRSAHERFSSLSGRLSLLETAEVVRRSTFFIGGDSAVAHMANTWRIPSLLLFGHYKGQVSWTPYEGFFAEAPDRWIVRHDGPMNEQLGRDAIQKLKDLACLRLEQIERGRS